MRILVVRALPGLGDLLCAVPALRALRARYPEAHVALVGLPAGALLTGFFPDYVDELLPFPGFPGLPEVPVDPPRIVGFLAEQQREPADLALGLHGSGPASTAFTVLLGARETAAFVPAATDPPDPARFLAMPEALAEPLRLLALLEHVGIPPAGAHLEFPHTDTEVTVDTPYAVVHAGSSTAARRWPSARFAAAADGLAERGLTVALTGTAAERDVVDEVRAAMNAPSLDLCARTSIGGLAALLRGAAVTVCNDTGTSHLAAAVGAPSVVLHVGSDPARWAPLDRRRHRSLGAGASAQDVLAEADALLGGS